MKKNRLILSTLLLIEIILISYFTLKFYQYGCKITEFYSDIKNIIQNISHLEQINVEKFTTGLYLLIALVSFIFTFIFLIYLKEDTPVKTSTVKKVEVRPRNFLVNKGDLQKKEKDEKKDLEEDYAPKILDNSSKHSPSSFTKENEEVEEKEEEVKETKGSKFSLSSFFSKKDSSLSTKAIVDDREDEVATEKEEEEIKEEISTKGHKGENEDALVDETANEEKENQQINDEVEDKEDDVSTKEIQETNEQENEISQEVTNEEKEEEQKLSYMETMKEKFSNIRINPQTPEEEEFLRENSLFNFAFNPGEIDIVNTDLDTTISTYEYFDDSSSDVNEDFASFFNIDKEEEKQDKLEKEVSTNKKALDNDLESEKILEHHIATGLLDTTNVTLMTYMDKLNMLIDSINQLNDRLGKIEDVSITNNLSEEEIKAKTVADRKKLVDLEDEAKSFMNMIDEQQKKLAIEKNSAFQAW